ncbi:hypothetical protein DT603_15515 [Pseudoxanthomonas gei]|uniref:Secreted protein n=1 Tax=Pseudoxanthomonas gei TaxID=1383030 RepID=A0ABX0AJ70_9GAMM|nr:hypothetical protein [Pseudoxanthomonas gei]NDK40246.1 hypothetical protein [Pseudoxanthomonas gei]
MSRIFLSIGLLLSLMALGGCAAPSTSSPPAGAQAVENPPAPPAAPAPPSAPAPPRTPGTPVALITTCSTSADCVVKDVGNCCGTMPACVNEDSPTDPAAVQAHCKARGMMSVCGFQELTACQCKNGKCVSAGPANPEPSVDPAEPVR